MILSSSLVGSIAMQASHTTRLPQLFYGPKVCMVAPKNNMDVRKDMAAVLTIIMANFSKRTILPRKRKAADPVVVIIPLKILTPIS